MSTRDDMLIVKGMISELPGEDQARVQKHADHLRAAIAADPLVQVAMAVVTLEIQALEE